MAKDILLKIHTPTKMILEEKISKVMLPAYQGKLTVLPDRVPSEILLNDGVLAILDDDFSVQKEFEIGQGVADIADDICQIFVTFAHKKSV